jgi:GT2 family glycosyltransferase
MGGTPTDRTSRNSGRTLPVSVVIPTIGRSDLLRRCLDSVLSCDPAADEVLVVDQSGGNVVQTLARDLGPRRVRVVPCEGRGVAKATNLGLREASHDLVLVTHDDCTVALDWVVTAERLVSEMPDGIVTGRVLPPDGAAYVPSTKSQSAPEDFTGRIVWDALYPANMAASRSAVVATGGFDERPGLLVAEDIDFCYRWLRTGRRLRYEPDLVVWHHDWRSPEDLVRTHQRYALSRGSFYGRHLRAGDWRHILPWVGSDLYQWARSLVGGALGRHARWNDHRREAVPHVLLGLLAGWSEARRLDTRAAGPPAATRAGARWTPRNGGGGVPGADG